MAVTQRNKNKVRPVMDFRELNNYVSSHTAQSDVCNEKLRDWRRMGSNVTLIDLRKAYLQLHVQQDLWRYQVVRYKGNTYCMTRLSFGLNVAPKIMSAVLNKVLSMNKLVSSGTDSYVDDIIVNEDIVSSETVLDLLQEYGLDAKSPVLLDGARVLGLHVSKDQKGQYSWRRDNALPNIEEVTTRRQLFSYCGQLIGHYPIASWLRPACSFVKRATNGLGWDKAVDVSVLGILKEIDERVKEADPVAGMWVVPISTVGHVWCDASCLALGACVEINGIMVEDASWLRKQNDSAHINLAEL